MTLIKTSQDDKYVFVHCTERPDCMRFRNEDFHCCTRPSKLQDLYTQTWEDLVAKLEFENELNRIYSRSLLSKNPDQGENTENANSNVEERSTGRWVYDMVCYILYSGLTTKIHIRTGLPPVRSITIAYKYKLGPYKDCGSLFRESCSIGPKLSCIGIFYDDPKKVPAQKCRYAVGSILSEGEDGPNEKQQQLYVKNGFRVFSFPEVTHVVTASFPHRTPLSIFLGVQRVYPQLNCYIKERKLCAHPFLEIYRGGMIHYMGPLAQQGDFYVPEVREAQRRLLGKESEQDGRTDITGADSHSERSSVSRLPPSESRDTSPALSTMNTHSHGDGDQHWDFDHVERSDTSSVSSFEELDLDPERTDRCDHTPPPITGSGKNNLQGQDREMMNEEE